MAIQDRKLHEVITILDGNPDSLETVGFSNANCRDKTPLMYALQCGFFELVDLLIERGADIHAKMSAGPRFSVLDLVAKFGHPSSFQYEEFLSVAKKLLALGANVDGALDIAIFSANFTDPRTDMIELLLESGGSLDYETPAGKTCELIEESRGIFDEKVLALIDRQNASNKPPYTDVTCVYGL